MPADLDTNPAPRPDRPRWRFGLAPSMALIAVLALGLGLMKAAPEKSDRWAGALFLVALLVGTLGLLVRRDRAAWVGFSLFGWTYALVALAPSIQAIIEDKLPTDEMIDRWVIDHIQPVPREPTEPLSYPARGGNENVYYKLDERREQWIRFQPTPEEAKAIEEYMAQTEDYNDRRDKFPRSRRIFYAFAGLAFAFVGSIAGRVLSDRALQPSRYPELQPSRQVG
jgi:hypothetical protein